MYLKRVEIQGFKSFADPIVIDFKEGVTCIIGPNGSGKSNISDAMRWVLGEQSAKTLRGGKMEEIIFAGTESRRPKGMAEVTMALDNSTGILPIDYAEVAIKRRLFRSGESEYYINGSQCRLRDVRELIMDTGIGVDGYSFIGQGRVDKIVSDKPETRREIFEEAAGIIKYKSQKAEAQRKLVSAGVNLDRMNDIILDIESRIGGLKTESEKAKEHAELSTKYRALEINITLKNIETTQIRSRELKEQFDEAKASIEKLRSGRVAAETALAALRKENDRLEEQITVLRAQIAENVNRTVALKGDALVSEEKQRSMDRDRSRLREESALLEARIAADQAREKELIAVQTEKDSHLSRLNMALGEKLKSAADRTAALSAVSEDIEEKKRTVFDLSRERSLKQQELSSNLDLMENFDTTKIRLTEELEQALADNRNLAAEKLKEEAAQAELAKEIAALTAETESLRTQYETATRETGERRSGIEKLRIRSEQLTARKKTIEEMESNYEGYNFGVRSLMKEKLPGIHGVVAERMEVPRGYETAIETALGATLQNVICEDDRSAKEAIRFLKQNRAGRLTFLPVSSIRSRERRAAEEMEGEKGFDGYAIDKLKFDSKYENIFDYLLGKVVVVDNLDNAVRLSKKNSEGYRIVTLDGEIINPAGALTGGAFKNKSANLLERKSEIASLSVEIKTLEQETEEAREALERLTTVTRESVEKLQETDRLTREKETILANLTGELKSLDYRLGEQEQRVQRRRRDLAGIETDKRKGAEMNDALAQAIEAVAEKIRVLETETTEAMARYEAEREKNEKASEEVTVIRLSVAEANVEKANADENADRVRRAIAETRAELEGKKEALLQLDAPDRSGEDAANLAAEIERLEQEKKTLEEDLEGMVGRRKDVQTKIEAEEYRGVSLTGEFERLAESKNAMEVELGRQDTRLTNWKEKLFEEFELSYAQALDFKRQDFVMSTAVKENRLIRERIRELGEVNPGAIRDYEETSERYEFLTSQRDDILKSMDDYQKIVTDMDKISKARFRDTFDKVVDNFDVTFRELFGGGKGELRLEDENDPLESGIEIRIRPPGKANLVSIDGYSGGERAMIAIALMFAILRAKPSPFCILDEIDAALDETNIHRFANYVIHFKETQFALVTHQRTTMEYADALFGVTMQEQGVTTILSLLLGERETEDFANKLEAGGVSLA